MWIATRLHHRCACHQFGKQFGYRKSSAYISDNVPPPPLYLTNTVLPVWFYQDWHLIRLLSRLDHTTTTVLLREDPRINGNGNLFFILNFVDWILSLHYYGLKIPSTYRRRPVQFSWRMKNVFLLRGKVRVCLSAKHLLQKRRNTKCTHHERNVTQPVSPGRNTTLHLLPLW